LNRILAGNGVVWDLNGEGRIQRNIPAPARVFIDAAIAELSVPRFAPALVLFDTAQDAFDARPRRDRDACSNVFDSMESVAKEVFNMPTATFGGVLSHVQTTRTLLSETAAILQALNTLRNRKFGHGMTTTFGLSPNEVDFTYLTCIGAILVFARL
jgi:hypothetical protein